MTESTTRVTSLTTTTETTTKAAAEATSLGTVTGDMTDLAALVAFLAAGDTAVTITGGGHLGAFAGDVARGAAAVAGFGFGGYGAFSAWDLLGRGQERGEGGEGGGYLLTCPWPGGVSEVSQSLIFAIISDVGGHTTAVVAGQLVRDRDEDDQTYQVGVPFWGQSRAWRISTVCVSFFS